MDELTFERLLYEEESAYLDFKREQYPFDGASNEVKSELLKDILAFANAWRETTAYILIGVQEVRGGKSTVAGITEHLDDAKLQQFVNSKTQRPVVFSYQPFIFDGKQVGVIRIPAQERPFFLTRDYGRLRRNIVCIRRSSSTDEASPDEILDMCRVPAAISAPSLDVNFVEPKSGHAIGKEIHVESTIIKYDASEIPDYGSRPTFASLASMSEENRDYFRGMAKYIRRTSFVRPFTFSVKNTGSVLAPNVRLKLVFPRIDGLKLIEDSDYPEEPSKQRNYLMSGMSGIANLSHLGNRINLTVSELENGWNVRGEFRDIQPKDVVISDDIIYIGSTKPREIEVNGLIYADTLPDPIGVKFRINIEVRERDLTLSELGLPTP